ncbi:hypothetical protein E4U34_006351 [Claviceps purpurea]|nr:hypothetical protein E4U34_006351 [Claviceps purpurea]KAG6228395.1 hypothetical protein E4U26_001042 [Claviceps purpurea]
MPVVLLLRIVRKGIEGATAAATLANGRAAIPTTARHGRFIGLKCVVMRHAELRRNETVRDTNLI